MSQLANAKIAEWELGLLAGEFALEMAFNILVTKRIFCPDENHRIDNFMVFNLRGEECAVVRQFLIDEFNASAILKFLNPLGVCHVHSPRSRPKAEGACQVSDTRAL